MPDQNTHPVIKQFEDEQMIAIEILYPLGQEDLHGEQMSEGEIRKMVDSLNKANEEGRLSPNINHAVNTEEWELVKAWVNECDCYIGDTLVPEGWPLAKTHFKNPILWKARKEGVLMGLSIGAMGQREVEVLDD